MSRAFSARQFSHLGGDVWEEYKHVLDPGRESTAKTNQEVSITKFGIQSNVMELVRVVMHTTHLPECFQGNAGNTHTLGVLELRSKEGFEGGPMTDRIRGD